ncbi:CamS family sex pheromone protein [Bacillus haikouensis]|jgi:protein involved in sex pheromone biosynthesis|uniref:CamS family sex pheromone protein n=1 Tax=Bacillus haikouensis TaxID=1510468 RepID=UPI001555F8E5|nr:CamS family sex pheromone protein [Bacillus haikouensis]NQD68034.1 CamS family sex pheromone protein [Bacillus haikouensis]
MKKRLSAALAALLILGGCAPTFEKQDQVVQENQDSESKKAIIPNFQISNDYYRTMLPYDTSKTRGVVVNDLGSRYDINEIENGLLRVAQNRFSTNEYFFKEGQFLTKKMVDSWLQRKYTSEQLAEKGLKESENLGLNPVQTKGEDAPIYLAHIVEHNYLMKKKDDNKVTLGGVVVALSLNSVNYETNLSTGTRAVKNISNEVLKEQGAKMAGEVLKRMREKEDLQNVPIMIALYKQAPKQQVVPGEFFAYTTVDAGASTIGDWEGVDEEYYIYPSPQAAENHPNDNKIFQELKKEIENYFPVFTGVTGEALYQNNKMAKLNLEVALTFNGKTETIGFAQYLSNLIGKNAPESWEVELLIQSSYGPEALVVKKKGSKETYMHIYE